MNEYILRRLKLLTFNVSQQFTDSFRKSFKVRVVKNSHMMRSTPRMNKIFERYSTRTSLYGKAFHDNDVMADNKRKLVRDMRFETIKITSISPQFYLISAIGAKPRFVTGRTTIS